MLFPLPLHYLLLLFLLISCQCSNLLEANAFFLAPEQVGTSLLLPTLTNPHHHLFPLFSSAPYPLPFFRFLRPFSVSCARTPPPLSPIVLTVPLKVREDLFLSSSCDIWSVAVLMFYCSTGRHFLLLSSPPLDLLSTPSLSPRSCKSQSSLAPTALPFLTLPPNLSPSSSSSSLADH